MKRILYLVALFLATDCSVYENIRDDVLSFFKRSNDDKKPRFEIETNNAFSKIKMKSRKPDLYQKAMRLKKKSKKDYETQQNLERELLEQTKRERVGRLDNTKTIGKENYQLDPVLNFLKRRILRRKNSESSSEISSSSSVEMEDWKDEWKEHWTKKKHEALNESKLYRGDEVNMVAARPWGVPCGDPNQHDMPWGTCMLPMECESEYRIFRGDFLCGRTQFICCALLLTNYDMYQGFDVSFDNSELSTDSEEKKNRGKGSKERNKRRKKRQRQRRKRERMRRKKKIKKNIRKIVREIRKILDKTYRNGSSIRKKKTKQLKNFIKDLKKKYKKDRKSVKEIHEDELIDIDVALQKKLNQIRDVNKNFMKNATFRDIIVNGTFDKQGARMLMQAYPDLSRYFADKTRRNRRRYYRPDYDVEDGLLYT